MDAGEKDTKESFKFGFREARGERGSCPEYGSSCVVLSNDTNGKSFRLAQGLAVSAQATVRRSRLATCHT